MFKKCSVFKGYVRNPPKYIVNESGFHRKLGKVTGVFGVVRYRLVTARSAPQNKKIIIVKEN